MDSDGDNVRSLVFGHLDVHLRRTSHDASISVVLDLLTHVHHIIGTPALDATHAPTRTRPSPSAWHGTVAAIGPTRRTNATRGRVIYPHEASESCCATVPLCTE